MNLEDKIEQMATDLCEHGDAAIVLVSVCDNGETSLVWGTSGNSHCFKTMLEDFVKARNDAFIGIAIKHEEDGEEESEA